MKVEAEVRKGSDMTLLGIGPSNHWVVMDTAREFGGNGAASTPLELLLMAAAGCSALDIISILKKKRANLRDLRIKIDAEKEDDFPKVVKKIHMHFLCYGNALKEEDVKRAIELSQEKYCSVSLTLRPGVEITHSWEILE